MNQQTQAHIIETLQLEQDFQQISTDVSAGVASQTIAMQTWLCRRFPEYLETTSLSQFLLGLANNSVAYSTFKRRASSELTQDYTSSHSSLFTSRFAITLVIVRIFEEIVLLRKSSPISETQLANYLKYEQRKTAVRTFKADENNAKLPELYDFRANEMPRFSLTRN